MNINFTKMHGLGNDFVVLNGLEQAIALDSAQMRLLADRRFGVGCDQILLLQPSEDTQVDARYRIFNADGGEVEQCGNGVRCVAEFLRRNGYVSKDEIVVDTLAGLIKVYIEAGSQVRVNMGVPVLEPVDIPIAAQERAQEYSLRLADGPVDFFAVSMGNPHAVITVADLDQAPLERIGPILQQHEFFPERVNVGFMQVLDRAHIRLRVYERGVGETLACGTGACAAVVAGIITDKLAAEVDVALAGGHLTINWDGEAEPVWMTGPATTVYEGQIDL